MPMHPVLTTPPAFLSNTALETDWDSLRRVVSLADHNTRVVLLGVVLLGLAAGVVGTLLLLRRRALLSDTVSHACLPGVAGAFLIAELWFGVGRSLPWLLLGAAVTATLAALVVHWLRTRARVREDAALAMVLSGFFAVGIALLSLVQQSPGGGAGGLAGFIFGKASALSMSDASWIASLSALALLASALLHKEFTILCFDEAFAQVQGWPVRWLDLSLMALVVAVTVTGLQAVGLLLVVALLIIPPAAARFWSDHLLSSMILAGLIGGVSGAVGVLLSALVPRAPSGAVIVLAAAFVFLVSFLVGSKRGCLLRWRRHRRQARLIGRDHLLRAVFERLEGRGITDAKSASRSPSGRVHLDELIDRRSWTRGQLRRLARTAARDGLLALLADHAIQLTRQGWDTAARLTRNHRLWELYLLHYAESAPAMVDRAADVVEHVVGNEVVERLERLLEDQVPRFALPASPHEMLPAPPPEATTPTPAESS